MIRQPEALRRISAGLSLFVLVCGVYLLIYRGWPMSGDEIFLFDSAQNFAREGRFYRTLGYDDAALPGYQFTPDANGVPWLRPVQEPLMPLLAAPLVLLGRALPETGVMHVVWLFNGLVIALTAVSLYAIGLRWGYPPAAGWLLGLLYAVSTNAAFYGRLLFREPLLALLLLWAFALALELQKQPGETGNQRRHWPTGLLLALIFGAALLTKVVVLLCLPGLLVVLLPPGERLRAHKGYYGGLLAAGTLAAAGFVAGLGGTGLGGRYDLGGGLDYLRRIQWPYVAESLLGYQVSWGRSLWLYSPVLLAGLAGAARLVRRGQWRIVLGPALTVLIFNAWYGVALTVDWLGGWGWGPRYMVPLLPVMLLWLLPVLAELPTMKTWRRLALAGLAAAGAGMQLLGMAVPLSNYYTDLFLNDKIYDFSLIRLDRAGVEAQWGWMDAIWTWQWSGIKYHLERLDVSRLDVAWDAASPWWIGPLLALGVMAGAAGWGAWNLRGRAASLRPAAVITLSLLALLAAAAAGGLVSLREDARYTGEWEDVRALVDVLNEQVGEGDAVFIDRHLYTPVFMNYFKVAALVVTLPYAPGENYDGTGPQVISDDPAEQIGYAGIYALDWAADHYDRLWLVTSASPFEAGKIRPIERYLVEHYFPVRQVETSPRARAVQFATVDAPQAPPAATVAFVFGERLRLAGYDLPAGTTYRPGETLPISLVWQAAAPLDTDYNVGLYLLDASGSVVAQQDGPPQFTFGFTSRWQMGQSYRDNHGLHLPETLVAGEYTLVVAVYTWQDGRRLSVEPGGAQPETAAALVLINVGN